MSTAPLAPLAAAPAGLEWWADSWTGWHARALRAEAEVAELRDALAAERQRNDELAALLQAGTATA